MSTTATPGASAAPSSAPSTSSSPASPSTSAPASTPAPETSTPVTPSTPSTPETTAPASTETPAAPAAPATTAKPQPKQSDFPGDAEGFLNALHEWEREGGEVAIPGDDSETKAPDAETETPAEETKPEEKADEEPEWAPEPETVTPEKVNGWAEKNPLLKQVWEQSPEIKQQMFQLARLNAKAAPLLELFPNAESGKFAAETANRFVDLRGQFTAAADDPSLIGGAYESLAQEFMIVDDKGNPVLDAGGNPTFTPDFEHMNQLVANTFIDQQIEDLEAMVATGGNEDAEYFLQTAKEFKKFLDTKDQPKGPDTSKMTPEMKAYFDQKNAELDAEREKLGVQKKAQSAEEKASTKATYEKAVAGKIGGSVGRFVKDYIATKEAGGSYIPSYVTAQKDPATGISVFAKNILDGFNAKTQSVAHIKAHILKLQGLPPSPEAEAQRVTYANELIQEFLPNLIDAEVRKVQAGKKADSEKAAEAQKKRKALASVEPTGGSASAAPPIGAEGFYEQAKALVNKNFPELQGAERQQKIFEERNRLQSR